jgi:hypothetical protein
MSRRLWSSGALTVVCALAAALAALRVGAQQEDVATRAVTRQTVVTEVAENPLAAWEAEYAKALDASHRLQRAPRTRALGERLELELMELDTALEAYVRAAERLRHKNRAVAATLDELPASDSMSSRHAQTIANALSVALDAEMATIRNLK